MTERHYCSAGCGAELTSRHQTRCAACVADERATRALCIAGIAEPSAADLAHARMVARWYARAEDVAYLIRVRLGVSNVF